MADIVILGRGEDLSHLTTEDSPADMGPHLTMGPIHKQARYQLYALLLGCFSEEAEAYEYLYHQLNEDGPYILTIDRLITDKLAAFEEDEVEQITVHWLGSAPMEALEVDSEDVLSFVFELVHLCKLRAQTEQLDLFICHEG